MEWTDSCYPSTDIPEVMTAKGGKCGLRPTPSSTVALSGSSAVNAPWMVSIGDNYEGEYEHNCGGSIIGSKIVLTAAHCITGQEFFFEDYVIVVGAYDLKNVDRDETSKFPIDKAVVHPRWQKTGEKHVYFDAGLVFTKRPFVFSPKVAPVCLPPMGHEQMPANLFGDSLTVVGWGRGLQDKHSGELVSIDVTINTKTECNTKYSQANTKRQRGQRQTELPNLLQDS